MSARFVIPGWVVCPRQRADGKGPESISPVSACESFRSLDGATCPPKPLGGGGSGIRELEALRSLSPDYASAKRLRLHPGYGAPWTDEHS